MGQQRPSAKTGRPETPSEFRTPDEPATRHKDDSRYLTPAEVADRLGVLPSWVNKAARAGRIPHRRVGRYRRFRWPEIEAWVESQRSGA